jgi:hypothetical protein
VLRLDLLPLVYVVEVLVGERRVRQGPEALGGLAFRCIGGLGVQMQARRDVDLRAHMPPRPVEYRQACLSWPAPTAGANSARAIVTLLDRIPRRAGK